MPLIQAAISAKSAHAHGGLPIVSNSLPKFASLLAHQSGETSGVHYPRGNSGRVSFGGRRARPISAGLQFVNKASALFGKAERRAFLLEDNEANGLVIEGMLDLLGYREIVWARNIAEAREYKKDILDGVFSIHFFDIVLPDGESFNLIEELVHAGAGRVCAYTARTSKSDFSRYSSIGCHHIAQSERAPKGAAGFW